MNCHNNASLFAQLFLMQFLSVPQMEGARSPQGEKSKPTLSYLFDAASTFASVEAIILKNSVGVAAQKNLQLHAPTADVI